MQIRDLIKDLNVGIKLSAEVLLADILGISRVQILTDNTRILSADELDRFIKDFKKLQEGVPVAYLTGSKEFYGLEFKVNRHVLIPRPETEMLVDKALEFAKDFQGPIIDIGTGSGCIAISLATKLKRKIVATDISEKAIIVARENAEKHGVNVDFCITDLMNGISGNFDIAVANLPYIGREKHNAVDENVKENEPHTALFSGEDGLYDYSRLFAQINDDNHGIKTLIGEIASTQGEDIKCLLNKNFAHAEISIHKDLASCDRMFVVRFPS